MPTYEHKCEACDFEWEDIFKMSDPLPEECPDCKVKGKIKRLISISSVKVELSGRELVEKLRADGKKIAKKSATDENLRANIVGEDSYHKEQLHTARVNENLKNL